jgi:hypothetical protein
MDFVQPERGWVVAPLAAEALELARVAAQQMEHPERPGVTATQTEKMIESGKTEKLGLRVRRTSFVR